MRLSDTRPWGWRITNYMHYRGLRTEDERREYNRLYYQNNRSKAAKSNSINSTLPQRTQQALKVLNRSHRDSTHADADANADTDTDADADADADRHSEKNQIRASAQRGSGPEFAELKMLYPIRAGSQRWKDAEAAVRTRLREGHTWNEILQGVRRYQNFIRETGKERTEHVQQAATFVGPNKGFLEPWDLPATKGDIRLQGNLSAAQEFLLRTDG